MSKTNTSKGFLSRHRNKIFGLVVGITLATLLTAWFTRSKDEEKPELEVETEDRYFHPAV